LYPAFGPSITGAHSFGDPSNPSEHLWPYSVRPSLLCRPRRSLYPSLFFLAGDVLAAMPAAPLAALLVSLDSRRLVRRAVRCFAAFFLLLTSCAARRSLSRSFLSIAEILPTTPLAESLVAFDCRRLGHRASPCIARLFLLPLT
jgi:hypothetical protein